MAEVAVIETLATLSTLASSRAKNPLPTAIGQRFEPLQVVVRANRPLALVGERVAKALDGLREHKRRRNSLCHGFSEVAEDYFGDMKMTLSLTSFVLEQSNETSCKSPQPKPLCFWRNFGQRVSASMVNCGACSLRSQGNRSNRSGYGRPGLLAIDLALILAGGLLRTKVHGRARDLNSCI